MDLPLENERAELKCQCATRRKNTILGPESTLELVDKQVKARFRIYNKEHSEDNNQVQLGTRKAAGKGCTLRWQRPAIVI